MLPSKHLVQFLLLQVRLKGLPKTAQDLQRVLAQAQHGNAPPQARRGRVGWQEVHAHLHRAGPGAAVSVAAALMRRVRAQHTANWLAQYEVEQRFKRGEITVERRDKYFQTLDLSKKIGE